MIFALKLTVLGILSLESAMPGKLPLAALFGLESPPASTAIGPRTASAAPTQGPAAPPPIEATLPDAGMDRPTPGQAALAGPVGASPDFSGPAEADKEGALPSIAPRSPGQGTGPNDTRDALARRQEDLARKEQELKVLESELASRLEKMRILENRLASMIKDAEETNDGKFRHLVDVLSNMKSRQAAAVLETLDPKIAVRVLAGMRGRQAGEVLTFVRPEIAAHLAESLARMQLPMQ